MERRFTTIVAADMVGYSRLVAADEVSAIDRFRHVRQEVIVPAIEDAGGRIIKTMGDGMLIEFASSSPPNSMRLSASWVCNM